jgi:hypothetical protein
MPLARVEFAPENRVFSKPSQGASVSSFEKFSFFMRIAQLN